jgi:hemerythrin superfamily protein
MQTFEGRRGKLFSRKTIEILEQTQFQFSKNFCHEILKIPHSSRKMLLKSEKWEEEINFPRNVFSALQIGNNKQHSQTTKMFIAYERKLNSPELFRVSQD